MKKKSNQPCSFRRLSVHPRTTIIYKQTVHDKPKPLKLMVISEWAVIMLSVFQWTKFELQVQKIWKIYCFAQKTLSYHVEILLFDKFWRSKPKLAKEEKMENVKNSWSFDQSLTTMGSPYWSIQYSAWENDFGILILSNFDWLYVLCLFKS